MSENLLRMQQIKVNKDTTSIIPSVEMYKYNDKKSYLIFKRVFDILVATMASVFLAVPMIIIAILIKIDSPGPVIYSQERLGKNGKPFIMYKFRSMHNNAEENGCQWAVENDDRCTRIGKVIRLFRVDELPQLWNILKGDMSVVGPRPERAYFYGIFKKDIPHFEARLNVLPGVTGLAQVSGGYDLLPTEKIVYDIEYMAKQSLWLDFVCVLKTFPIIFNHKGAR